MGRLWREQGKLQVFYLYKILARLETAFLFATIAVILSFPLRELYFLAEKTGSSVYILDAWLLALNKYVYPPVFDGGVSLLHLADAALWRIRVVPIASLFARRRLYGAAVRLDAPGGFRGPGNSTPVHPVVCAHRVRTERVELSHTAFTELQHPIKV